MATAHFNPPLAKRVKVQSDNNPQPRWLLVPTASRTVQDLLRSLLLRLGLPGTCTYDLCLDGTPILPNEDIALVRDGEELHLRLRQTPTATPTPSQPSNDPHMSATSIPENTNPLPRKRKRVLTPEGKRRRNGRNRKREKRRRLERRQSQNDVPDINNSPPVSDQVQDPSPKNPDNRAADQEDPATMKENGASSVPIITPTGHTDQSPTTNEATDEITPIFPKGTTPHVNMNSNQELRPQEGDNLTAIPAAVPSPSRDDCPPSTKPQLEPASHSDHICPGVSPQQTNPGLSYVFLQKVSIEPSPVNMSQKVSSEKQKKSKSAKELKNGPDVRPSAKGRPAIQAASDKTSGLIRDEIMSNAEDQTAEETPVETRRKPSAEPAPNLGNTEKKDIAESANKVSTSEGQQPEGSKVRAPERQQPEVNNSENAEDGAANALEVSATNATSKENDSPTCALMETDNGAFVNTAAAAAIRLASKEQVQKSSRVHQGSKGDPSDEVYPSKNVNPRWKRRRPQGKTSKHKNLDLGSEHVPPVMDDKHIQSSHRKDPEQQINREAQPLLSDQAKEAETGVADVNASGIKSVAEVNASATKSAVCDVINLVDDDEDDGKLFDNLPVLMHHSRNGENRSKSTSPQSIVVAEPQTGDSHAARDSIKVMKASSLQGARENAGSGTQAEREEIRQESGIARASRRKSARPRRLNKPEAEEKFNKVGTVSSASPSRDISHEEDNREALETLKNEVVNDLQSSRPEVATTQNKDMTQSIVETPVQEIPEANENSIAKGASKPEVRNEVKRNRKSLRGSWSTLAALRVAKAHAAIRSSSSKDMNDTIPQKLRVRASDASQSRRGGSTAMNKTARVRKKRTRSKKSENARRYLNEEQYNKSIFVGSRPETLLPPPELLELPDGSQDFAQNSNVPETVPKTYVDGKSYVGLSDSRKEAQPLWHDKAPDNVDENQSFGLATTSADRSNTKKSFNPGEPLTEKALTLTDQGGVNNEMSTEASPVPREGCDVVLLAEEPPLRVTGQEGVNNDGSTEASPAPQEAGDVDLLAEEPPLHLGLHNEITTEASLAALGDIELLAEDAPLHLADQAGVNNEESAEVSPAAQEGGDADRENDTDRNASTHRTAPAASLNCFREDLVHMLQDTTQTLAKVWSKWEG